MMKSVFVKSGNVDDRLTVRSLSAHRDDEVFSCEFQQDQLFEDDHINPEVRELRRRVLQLEASLELAQKQIEDVEVTAHAAGLQAATEQFESDETARLEVLAQSLKSAPELLQAALDRQNHLALALTQSVVSKFFSEASQFSGMIVDALYHQLQQLKIGPHIRLDIRLSESDFSSVTDAEASLSAAGLSNFDVSLSSQLAAGACDIDLKQGHIRLSLSDEWLNLQALFNELANEAVI